MNSVAEGRIGTALSAIRSAAVTVSDEVLGLRRAQDLEPGGPSPVRKLVITRLDRALEDLYSAATWLDIALKAK